MASSRHLPASYNISTFGPDGGGYDYEPNKNGGILGWITNTNTDLVSAQRGEVLDIYGDGSSLTTFTMSSTLRLVGAVTDASYFRVIRKAPSVDFDHTPNTGVRIYNTDTTTNVYGIGESYSQIQDLVLAGTIGDRHICTLYGNSAAFVGCVFDIAGGASMVGICVFTENAYLINVIFCDTSGTATTTYGIYQYSENKTGYLYNCTVGSSVRTPTTQPYTLFSGSSLKRIVAKNCIIPDGSTGAGVTKVNCLEADAAYRDAASNDFHLSSTDTLAKDQGADLTSDPYYPFDDDIDMGTRSGTWDIGADEEGVELFISFVISGTLKERASDVGGSQYDYAVIQADFATPAFTIVDAATSAPDGEFIVDVADATTRHFELRLDPSGTYPPKIRDQVTGVGVESGAGTSYTGNSYSLGSLSRNDRLLLADGSGANGFYAILFYYPLRDISSFSFVGYEICDVNGDFTFNDLASGIYVCALLDPNGNYEPYVYEFEV